MPLVHLYGAREQIHASPDRRAHPRCGPRARMSRMTTIKLASASEIMSRMLPERSATFTLAPRTDVDRRCYGILPDHAYPLRELVDGLQRFARQLVEELVQVAEHGPERLPMVVLVVHIEDEPVGDLALQVLHHGVGGLVRLRDFGFGGPDLRLRSCSPCRALLAASFESAWDHAHRESGHPIRARGEHAITST